MDYYQILGVEKDASILTIKTAYKKQVLTCHPDKVSPSERPQAEEKFKLLTEAYKVLVDPSKRLEYDSCHFRPDPQDSWNIFDDFFTQRDLISDPFSHPFFSSPSNLFSSSSLLSHLSSRSDAFFSSDPFFTSDSTFSQTGMREGISKTIKETRSGNYIIREEIVTENGNVVSRTKTSTLSNSRPGSYKIHIS